MSDTTEQSIRVNVSAHYVEGQSEPTRHRYVFSYTITITNLGARTAKLLSRHWIITDAEGNQQEVHGDGVVGEQPTMAPGEGFRYTSGAILKTPVGSMQGSYTMVDDDGNTFKAPIDPFTLAVPGYLH
ncbi:MAG: Co2+/Mg2+ efflux protein ApaG [Pseudomonadota bacterium]